DPPLYEGDELRASLGNGGDVRTSSEEILVRPGGHRRLRPDQADAVVSGRGYGAADRGEDDLDDRDRVAFAGIAHEGRGGGVAGDDDHLLPAGNQIIGDHAGVLADLRDRLIPIRRVRDVPDVDDGFVRQQIHDRARHGETADPGVEDPDGRIVVGFLLQGAARHAAVRLLRHLPARSFLLCSRRFSLTTSLTASNIRAPAASWRGWPG